MTGSGRSKDSMGHQPRSMPRRYDTHGAVRTALPSIYSSRRCPFHKLGLHEIGGLVVSKTQTEPPRVFRRLF